MGYICICAYEYPITSSPRLKNSTAYTPTHVNAEAEACSRSQAIHRSNPRTQNYIHTRRRPKFEHFLRCVLHTTSDHSAGRHQHYQQTQRSTELFTPPPTFHSLAQPHQGHTRQRLEALIVHHLRLGRAVGHVQVQGLRDIFQAQCAPHGRLIAHDRQTAGIARIASVAGSTDGGYPT